MRKLLLLLTAAALVLPFHSAARATPAVPAAPAAPAAAWAPATTFATYNICHRDACANGRHAWDRRINAIVNTIRAADADILAVQETEVEDGSLAQLAELIGPLGYALANTDASTCLSKCDSHLFYKTAKFELIDDSADFRGTLPLSSVAPDAPWDMVQDRSFAFAFLRNKLTQGDLLALSIHLPHQMLTAGRAAVRAAAEVRVESAAGLARWTRERAQLLGFPKIPTFIMGDYNSYLRKQPRGPQYVLQQAGFVNADRARKKINRDLATINRTPIDMEWKGFPPRPRRYESGGPQIDAIMARGAGTMLSWEIFVRTLRNGKFDPRFRGSDHNLVRATIRLPVI